jgi:hypothetical protein
LTLLVITNSDDATADYLCGKFRDCSCSLLRIDTDKITSSVSVEYKNDLEFLIVDGAQYPASCFENVWFRRPKPIAIDPGLPVEDAKHISNEWKEAIEGFLAHIPLERWMNHPSRNANASHKIEQLTRAKQFGFVIPPTLVTQNTSEAKAFFEACKKQLIIKPLASGYIERDSPSKDSIIYTSLVPENLFSKMDPIQKAPILLQKCVERIYDVRVNVVDHEICAVALKSPDTGNVVDVRRNNMDGIEYQKIELPSAVGKSVREFCRSYGLRFSAMDLILTTDNEWVFLENNPNGQWAWLDIAGGQNIHSLFFRSFFKARISK